MINGYMRGTAGATVLARHAHADVFVCDVGTAFDLLICPRYIKKVAWEPKTSPKVPVRPKGAAVGMEMAGYVHRPRL